MARHLECAHKNKPEVAQAMSFPKDSKERRMHLEHLRNKGNFTHNVNVLDTGSGKRVPCKQPQQETLAQDFLYRVYCQGFFQKKILWWHMLTCKFKPCDRHTWKIPCSGPLFLCFTSTTWCQKRPLEAIAQHGSGWQFCCSQNWCLYFGVWWTSI